MKERTAPDEGLTIAAVEQATGIARATLRIWERRYGFPQPGRDARGERCYPQDQVAKLQLIARLMDQGHRPGRLVAMGAADLEALGGLRGRGRPHASPAGGDPVIAALQKHDVHEVTRLLQQDLRERGLAGFVAGRLAPLNVAVGQAWARGELQVFEEHLYAECVQQLVRAQLAALERAPGGRPRVVLATLPDEAHGLGLLMAEAVLVLEGCACASLGLRVPVSQLVSASKALGADVIGLSFAPSMNPANVLRGLEQLRAALPPNVAVWAGGRAPVLARQRIPGVRTVADIGELPEALAQWRAERPELSALPATA